MRARDEIMFYFLWISNYIYYLNVCFDNRKTLEGVNLI